ncbi:MAG: MAPEG family protein [Paracoccaceae bacterium]
MLFWILAGLGVFLANVLLPAIIYFTQSETLTSHVGSRDDDPEPSVWVARARRSLANMHENLPFFLTLGVLALVVENVDMGQAILGAQMFVFARVAFMVLYVTGVPWLRTISYLIGLVGCFKMALALI